MKRTILLLISPLLLSASLFDFLALDKAQESYTEGNYTQAVEAYESLEEKSDEVLYDEANSYYKLKEYKKAKELYSAIKKESLLFNKWHNLGNCNAQLNKIDEGIKAYEEALKIKEDADTRFNLELLKKKKKEQKKQDKKEDKKKNDKDKKKDDKNEQNKKDKDKQEKESKDKKNQDKKDKGEQKDKDKKDKTPEEKKKEEEKKQEEEKKDKEKRQGEQQQAQAQMKKEPISDKELRKYQKMLDKRGINTLLVPLKTEGEHNNEFKPW